MLPTLTHEQRRQNIVSEGLFFRSNQTVELFEMDPYRNESNQVFLHNAYGDHL